MTLAPTIRFEIFIAGDLSIAKQVCREYCFEVGLCVTVEPVTYIYTGGEESGVRVGLINYPRFPADAFKLRRVAGDLADLLRERLCQTSYTVVGPDETEWVSMRSEDVSNDPGVKIAGWFSAGNNSAVTCKLLTTLYPRADIRLVRCLVPEEHTDNARFHVDVERWVGRTIHTIKSDHYVSCQDVWEKRRYMAGIKGAPCTVEMKKVPRWDFEKAWQPDYQAFGFSSDESSRSERFIRGNPEVRLLRPLEDAAITKPMCAEIVSGAGIVPATMYTLGFSNNNCVGCVKATSIAYWARVRHYFPEVFLARAALSRSIGCRLTRLKGVRIFLDEIPADYPWDKKDRSNGVECGVLCGTNS